MAHRVVVNTRTFEEGDASGGTRQERKQRTRQSLLDAALVLLEEQSFSTLSLREVTRAAGIVPTAFYRHFHTMEELGLALVDESFRTLRDLLRAVRAGRPGPEQVIRGSVGILVRHVHEHRAHFRFVVRERHSGNAALRHAIRGEIRLFASELAIDLARFPGLDAWSARDLQMLAGLLVNAMVSTAEAILDVPLDSPEAEAEAVHTAEAQLRLIALGAIQWRSEG